MELHIVKREGIDALKWDSCNHYAFNGGVYSYSWFLDNICEDWFGIVEGDYASVFPICFNAIKNKKTIYQPIPALYNGIITNRAASDSRIKRFIEAIPSGYELENLSLNSLNKGLTIEGREIDKKQNALIYLDDDYTAIAGNYSSKVLRELGESKKNNNLQYVSNVSVETIVSNFQESGFTNDLNNSDFHAFHRVFYNALHRGIGMTAGVVDEKGTVLASCFIMFSHGRAICFLPSQTNEGRKVNARTLMIDTLIQTNGGKKMALDFQDDLMEIGKSFGCSYEPYFSINKIAKKSFLSFFR